MTQYGAFQRITKPTEKDTTATRLTTATTVTDEAGVANDENNDEMTGVQSEWMVQDNNNIWTSTSTLDSEIIYLVVSGKKFCIAKSALLTFPKTKLGQLALRHSEGHGRLEYVFDRNSKIMSAVLDLYRTGELHLPINLCCMSIRRELMYWGIPDALISECCYGRYSATMMEMNIVDELDKVMVTPAKGNNCATGAKLRDALWQTIEKPGSTLASVLWLGVYMSFIFLSIVVVCLSTMQRFRVDRDNDDGDNSHDTILDDMLNSDLSTPLMVLDTIGLLFFTIELFVRIVVTPDRKQHLQQFLTILDIVLAMNHLVCFLMEQADSLLSRHRSARYIHVILRSLLSFRVLRIFHLARRCVKMKALLLTLRASIGEILLLFLGVSIAVIIFATTIYYVEAMEGEGNFQNIPQAIWWAIITMTTVGYGDYYPVSVAGYVIGTFCALSGLLLLSMPIAIIANNFNTYTHGLGARDQREKRQEALRDILGVADNDGKDKKDTRDEYHHGDTSSWMTCASNNTRTTTENHLGIRYLNGPHFKKLSQKRDHLNLASRRLSDGAVEMVRPRKNRDDLSHSQNLKTAISEKMLYLPVDHFSSVNDVSKISSDSNDVKSLQTTTTPNCLWSSHIENGMPTIALQDNSKEFSNLHSMESVVGGQETHPQNVDSWLATNQQNVDNWLSNPRNMDKLWLADGHQPERSRRRKYRRKRKTWGSTSRLSCFSTGHVWTALQGNVRSKQAYYKPTT